MARGRSATVYERLYINGYNLNAYVMDAGERGVEHDQANTFCWADLVTGTLLGKHKYTFGPVNGVFDNTVTTGLHVLADGWKKTQVNLTHVRGVRAAPAIGDDVFCAPMVVKDYKGTNADNLVTARLDFESPQANTSMALTYSQPFGQLLHAWSNEVAVNAAHTNADGYAASTAGGWMMYHIYSISGGGGTVTISIDESDTGVGAWGALAGATSGAIAAAAAPTSGYVQLGTTAAVKRYLRWQIAFGAPANGCTFLLSFMRG